MGHNTPYFVTLGMFIIDDFSFADEDGNPTGKAVPPQESTIGGGGTYAAIGARIWLPAQQIRMIIDKGHDFPADIEEKLLGYGRDMWAFRDQPTLCTTRALNSYRGEHRNFEYTTARVRITPNDLPQMKINEPAALHFICSPTRAAAIISEVHQTQGWSPTTIYEPIPDRCVPEELPALRRVLSSVSILSPNAEEALSLLSLPQPPSRWKVEQAADILLEFGIGKDNEGHVIIRSGGLGAYVKSASKAGEWVDAYWTEEDGSKIVDVTGAGNGFLGGLAAGILLCDGDVYEATFHASISASFVIEQQGLPAMSYGPAGATTVWNGETPEKRLLELRKRHEIKKIKSTHTETE